MNGEINEISKLIGDFNNPFSRNISRRKHIKEGENNESTLIGVMYFVSHSTIAE